MSAEGRTVSTNFLDAIASDLRKYKTLAEKTFDQLDDADLHYRPDPESNSIYILVKHLAGNMRSRWTDIFTTDGEKQDRHRDTEFVEDEVGRPEMMRAWEGGWRRLLETLDGLTGDDLLRTIYIREQPHTVLEAIVRQHSHYAYHVGQLIYLAKHLKADRWQTLSIPKGRSGEYVPKRTR